MEHMGPNCRYQLTSLQCLHMILGSPGFFNLWTEFPFPVLPYGQPALTLSNLLNLADLSCPNPCLEGCALILHLTHKYLMGRGVFGMTCLQKCSLSLLLYFWLVYLSTWVSEWSLLINHKPGDQLCHSPLGQGPDSLCVFRCWLGSTSNRWIMEDHDTTFLLPGDACSGKRISAARNSSVPSLAGCWVPRILLTSGLGVRLQGVLRLPVRSAWSALCLVTDLRYLALSRLEAAWESCAVARAVMLILRQKWGSDRLRDFVKWKVLTWNQSFCFQIF